MWELYQVRVAHLAVHGDGTLMRYKTGEYDNWDDLIAGLKRQYGKNWQSNPTFEEEMRKAQERVWEAARTAGFGGFAQGPQSAPTPKDDRQRFYFTAEDGTLWEYLNGAKVPADGELQAYAHVEMWRDPSVGVTTYQFTGGCLDEVTYKITDRDWQRTRELSGIDQVGLAVWLLQAASEMIIEGDAWWVDDVKVEGLLE